MEKETAPPMPRPNWGYDTTGAWVMLNRAEVVAWAEKWKRTDVEKGFGKRKRLNKWKSWSM